MKHKFRFPPAVRLRKRAEFERLHKSSRKLNTKHFVVLIAASTTTRSRLGVTVTTKVEPRAVGRNRIKRCVREVFRHCRAELRGAFDIVVIARQNAPQCSFAEIREQLQGALHHHGYLK